MRYVSYYQEGYWYVNTNLKSILKLWKLASDLNKNLDLIRSVVRLVT